MPDIPRSVPRTHQELSEALAKGLFPDERYWIDFKRQLFPSPKDASGNNTPGERQKAFAELARDVASMATRGGVLVLGVDEDKSTTPPTFTPRPMPLPPGIKDDIDRAVRDRITPPVYLEVTALEDPQAPGTGFIVVEVPDSDLAPHMVDGGYFGRSDSGRTKLSDDQVEHLMGLRSRRGERIKPEMALTRAADPIAEADRRGVPHGYFTAVPVHGWPDMFADYTKDRRGQQNLAMMCSQRAITRANASRGRHPYESSAIGDMQGYLRSSEPHGAWLHTWNEAPRDGIDRMVGVDDDGPVRLVDLGLGSTATGRSATADSIAAQNPGHMSPTGPARVYEVVFYDRVSEVLGLVAELSDIFNYTGSWLLGVRIDWLRDRVSQTEGRSMFAGMAQYNADEYTATARATHRQLAETPHEVTKELLLRFFRGLGTASILDDPQF